MLVTRLAELREQQRLAELARARNEEQQQRSSLEQLRNYREEYCRQIERGGSGIGGAAHMANFMRFISDIDAASELQQRHVDTSVEVREAASIEWQQQYARRTSLQGLVDKALKQERYEADRQQQKSAEDAWLINHHRQ